MLYIYSLSIIWLSTMKDAIDREIYIDYQVCSSTAALIWLKLIGLGVYFIAEIVFCEFVICNKLLLYLE